MKAPFFSVIVPVYNANDVIEGCIQSVLSQTEPDFELVLVDDGSKDDSGKILDTYLEKDSRILVFHQENQGHTSARNRGLSESHGEYVLFLDCDDALEPRVLEVCKNAILKSQADLLIFGICKITKDTRQYYKNMIPDGVYENAPQNELLIKNLLLSEKGNFTFPKSLSGKVFHRKLAKACQESVPKEILMGEDGLAFVSAVLQSKTVSVCSQVYYQYLIRETSISHKGDPYAFRRFQILLTHYREKIIPLHPLLEEQFHRFVVAQLDTASRLMMRSGCTKQEFLSEWKKLSSVPFIKTAIRSARFSPSAWKMRIKQQILMHSLFGLGKFLLR